MTGPVYHWLDERGAWQLARKVTEIAGTMRFDGPRYIEMALVRHLYSNHLEWVPQSKLRPYPSEPIPEPEVR